MPKDLARVVLRAQQGDHSAFAELYEQTHNYYYFLVCKWLGKGNENDALDVLQESYLEIFKTIANLKNPDAANTWMTRVVYHQCTRFFKVKPKNVLYEDEQHEKIIESVQDLDEEFLPQEALENNELKNFIVDIVNNLPVEQKTVTLLYYFDELSIGAIAEIVNCSEGTVKSRLRLSREKLKVAAEKFFQKGAQLYALASLPILSQILQETSENYLLTADQAKQIFLAAAGGAGLALSALETSSTSASSSSSTSAASASSSSVGNTASVISSVASPLKVIIAVTSAIATISGIAAGVIVLNGGSKHPSSSGSDAPPYSESSTLKESVLSDYSDGGESRPGETSDDNSVIIGTTGNYVVTTRRIPAESTTEEQHATTEYTTEEPSTESSSAESSTFVSDSEESTEPSTEETTEETRVIYPPTDFHSILAPENRKTSR